MGIVKFFMSYWKPLMLSLLIAGAYFYGYSNGIESQKVEQMKAVKKAQEKDAKELAIIQQQLIDTEAELLNSTDKIKIEYRTKTKEVVKYVKEHKGVNGVDLNKCILDDAGLQHIRDAYK